MKTVEVTMPGGFASGGTWHRTALLRPLCGRDEAFLAEEARHALPAERTTALLARLLERCGTVAPVTRDLVRTLTVGDRDALLLHLRRLTLGERISCVLACPACGERMDLDLNVADLLVAPYGHEPREVYETEVEGGGRTYRVRFRLPNGADQEAAAAVFADEGLEAAEELILRRCVESSMLIEKDGERDERLPRVANLSSDAKLPTEAARSLQQLMSKLDGQAEVVLRMTCPACEGAFVLPFDIADYFFRELTELGGDVYREVHTLALHYHWGEAEIMAMPRRRRRLYLSLLADAAGKGSA